jgi:hypothetical protein
MNSDIYSIKSPNQALSYWLTHSYLYYVIGDPIMSDNDFNTLSQWLIKSWHLVDHMHKDLVTIDNLKASSGFDITYPKIVESCAWQLLREKAKVSPAATPKKKAVQKKPVKNSTLEKYDTLFG